MTDRRLTPVNDRVAAAHLGDAPANLARVTGEPRRVAVPVADLCRDPGGARDRQLLFGEEVRVYETRDGWCFVQAEKDGYVGYLRQDGLAVPRGATHWVSAASTHLYVRPDIKSPDRMALSFGSRLSVDAVTGAFAETRDGFAPLAHLSPLGTVLSDPLDVARRFLGTPYLWGGNSRSGIDCSGLVQAAFLACGAACPGDSDLQETALGPPLEPGTPPERGDLLFWKGHVAMVGDPDTILHANAFHMAVAFEPLRAALDRIRAQGDGDVTSHVRPSLTGSQRS